jgi:hypothetical protein
MTSGCSRPRVCRAMFGRILDVSVLAQLGVFAWLGVAAEPRR